MATILLHFNTSVARQMLLLFQRESQASSNPGHATAQSATLAEAGLTLSHVANQWSACKLVRVEGSRYVERYGRLALGASEEAGDGFHPPGLVAVLDSGGNKGLGMEIGYD